MDKTEITQAQYELKKYEQLKADKATVQKRLNQLAHYIFPRKYNIDINGEQTTTDLPTDVYDGTAIYALKVMAAGLSSYLTNAASKWFTFSSETDTQSKVASLWLQNLEKAVYRLFNESNFYQAISEMYKTLAAFGTGIMYKEADRKSGRYYQTFDIMNCALETDGKGRIIGLYRDFYYTALQCVEEYGQKNVPKIILDAIKTNSSSKFNILHVVRPRRKYEEGKLDKKNKKISSCYYLMQTKDLLKEDGFDKFPFDIARFETNPNDPYGYGPTEDSLPDIQSLNQAVYDWHEAVQRANNPIVVFPSDSYGAPDSLAPGDVIFKQGGDTKEKIETIGGTNPNISLEMLRDIRTRIQQSFFVDLFFAITNETKRMTIPEVQERIAEKMNILGSALHSLTNELLKPLVEDAIDAVIKQGWVEQAPEELQDMDIRFIGPLARAQRNVDAAAIQNWVQMTQNMAATPELSDALDVVNATNASRDLAVILGVPVENVRSDDEVMQIRQARQQAQQARIEAQQMQQQADIGETASKIEKNQNA